MTLKVAGGWDADECFLNPDAFADCILPGRGRLSGQAPRRLP